MPSAAPDKLVGRCSAEIVYSKDLLRIELGKSRNMVSAATCKDRRSHVGLAKRNAVVVDVLELSDFAWVHGSGPLDAVHPKICGQLDLPPEFLTSGAEVRKWRGFSKQQQAFEIKRFGEEREKRFTTESRSRCRAKSIRRREERLAPPPASDIAHLERLAAATSTEAGGVGGRGVSPPAAPSAPPSPDKGEGAGVICSP